VLITNRCILRTIFAAKRNFARGVPCAPKIISGVEIAPFQGNARTAVCISGDFELSWAWRGRGDAYMTSRGTSERANFPFILDLLDEYSVPVTWATVGHLFLERCNRNSSGVAHPEMSRTRRNRRWEGDWYLHDPCTDFRRDPLWYAPDLISRILEARTHHELGTHSFSHINFSPECSTPELVRAEIEACRAAMAPLGASPKSLVFPHNIMGYSHLPLLSELGITAIRHRDPKVLLSYPERTRSGAYRLYESMHLRVPRHYEFSDKAVLLLQEAMERRSAFCFWFHPSDPVALFRIQFRQLLQRLDEMRKAGLVWITTMANLAAYCEARHQLDLDVARDAAGLTVLFKSDFDGARYGRIEVTLLFPGSAPPQSAWYVSRNGKKTPVTFTMARVERSEQLAIDVPADAASLRVQF
jgi:hypothetical protein